MADTPNSDDNEDLKKEAEALNAEAKEEISHEERAAAAMIEDEISPVEQVRSASGVAMGGRAKMAGGVVFILFMSMLAFSFFSGDEDTKPPVTGDTPTNPADVTPNIPAIAPPQSGDQMGIAIPPPPTPIAPPITPPMPPPPITSGGDGGSTTTGSPPPPPPPPPPPEIKALNPFGTAQDEERKNRMRSPTLVSGVSTGGVRQGAPASGEEAERTAAATSARESLALEDPNRNFVADSIASNQTVTAVAKKINNLEATIIQGKIIEAVLETAIDTSLPGTLRAIVSRDIYPESGRNVMIPKGSRLIGDYNTSILQGQRRVMIVWTRVVRPDGVDIAVGSGGVDPLGRAGMDGHVNNRYMEVFSTAILTSMISLGVAAGAEAVIPGKGTTTSNTDGSSTNTGSPGNQAGAAAVGNIGDVATKVVTDSLDVRPTITVDQGARVNVFVNRDLVFPTEIAQGRFVQ